MNKIRGLKNTIDICHAFSTYGMDVDNYGETSSSPVYFSNGIIYSYGPHFPMAKFVSDVSLLFTLRTYSSTTARHLSQAMSALSQYKLIYVENPCASIKDNLDYFKKSISDAILRLKASKRGGRQEDRNLVENYTKYLANYLEFLNLEKLSKDDKKEIKDANAFLKEVKTGEVSNYLANEEKKHKKQIAAAKKAEKQRMLARQAKLEDDKVKFLNGEINYIYGSDTSLIRVDGENVITSQNVKMKLEIVLRAFKNFKKGTLGERLVDYRIIKADKEEVIIGCHNFKTKHLEETLSPFLE